MILPPYRFQKIANRIIYNFPEEVRAVKGARLGVMVMII
jgi:hypothetical protein